MARTAWMGAALAVALTAAGPAFADSIDGQWCDTKGHSLQIQGSTIVTPGGSRIEGSYSRHNFSYKVPDRETPAGAAVSMVLMNENTVRATVGAEPSEIWHRCSQTS